MLVKILRGAAACLLAAALDARAATWTWNNSGGTGEWNTTVDNWVEAGTFATGDIAQWTDSSPTGSIFIGTGAVAGSVSPSRVYFHYYGRTWTFSGGDILTGDMLIDWDSTAIFNHTGSLSFPGGLTDTHNSGIIRYQPTGGAAVHFGTGDINLSGGAGNYSGQFQFSPTSPGGTLTNNIVIGATGGSLGGNGNGVYAGTVTLNGNLRAAFGRNIYNTSFLLNGGNRTINVPAHYASGSWSLFDGTVSGPANTVTIVNDVTQGTWTDWQCGLTGSNPWNVRNVELRGGIIFVNNPATLFGPTRTNGGQVSVWGVLAPQSTANDNKNGTFDASGAKYVLMQACPVPQSSPRSGSRIQANIVNVGTDGTLGGIGEIYCNTLNVNSGGTIAPGTSAGTLTSTGNTTFAAGSNLSLELNGTAAGTGYDQFLVNGSLVINGANLLVQMGYEPASNDPIDTFTVVVNDGVDAITGTLFSGIGEGGTVTLGGFGRYWTGTASVTYTGGSGNDIVLYGLHLVPEPAGLACLALGAALLFRRRR